jgi:hypothetical protein
MHRARSVLAVAQELKSESEIKEARMRKLLMAALILSLSAPALIAASGGEPKAKSPEKAQPASSANSGAAPVQPITASELEQKLEELSRVVEAQKRELEAQREQLRQQQQRTQALADQLKAASVARENLSAPAGNPASGVQNVALVSTPGAGAPGIASRAAAGGVPEPKEKGLLGGKLKVGVTFFGDYAFYAQTGFGPQFLTQINQPGPGNDTFNSFDVTRTYINLFFMPNDRITFRVTPNIYRQVGSVSGDKISKVSGVGPSVDGNLTFRLKYAYVDFNKVFEGSDTFGKDKMTIGQETNPLIDWEEGLYGYRFVNLVPWNYLSLSSTYVGASLRGPIEFGGKQYLDYDVGAFNNNSFHSIEQSEKKQVMARLSYYPFGATSKYQGLGLTGFYDYGFKSVAPDTDISTPIYRVAALAHYTSSSNAYGLAFEFDYGRNAFGSGNFFSGSGPLDQFGLGTTQYAAFDGLAKALLDNDRTKQRGFDAFGHVRLGGSPFSLFGLFQYFQPNTNVDKDPLDFQRILGGISYQYNKNLRFALDSQNLIFFRSQFTFPAAELARFNPGLAASNPGGIPNAVPKNTNAVFFNVEFNY